MRLSRDLVLPSLVMASEAIVLSLWVRILLALAGVSPLPPYFFVLVISMIACIGVRLVQPKSENIRTGYGLIGGLGVSLAAVTIALGPGWPFSLRDWIIDPLLTLPTPIAYLFVAGFAWFRGVRVAMKTMDTYTIEESFQFSGLGLVVGAIAAGLMAAPISPEPLSDVPLSAVTFFVTGLASLAIARLRLLRQSGPTTQGTTQRWMMTTLATIVGIILVAVLLAIVTPGPLGGLGGLLGPLVPYLRYLDPIIMFLIYPIALLMERILIGIAGMMLSVSRLIAGLAGIQQANPEDAPLQLPPPEEMQAVIRSFEWTVVIGIVAMFCLVIWLILRRRRMTTLIETEEERETVWSWREFFAMLWSRLQSWRRKTVLAILTTEIEAPQSAEAKSVRAVYRQFLQESARMGRVRPTGTTPYEYVRSFAFPEPATDLTELYVRVRYGPDETRETDVDAARSFLQRIHEDMATNGTTGSPHQS